MIPDNYFRRRTEPIGMVRDAIRYASYRGYTVGLIAGLLAPNSPLRAAAVAFAAPMQQATAEPAQPGTGL
jgi:hypothetical protein